MKTNRIQFVCALALLSVASASWGQSRVYRCGNEYTNNAAQAKKENCRLVEGGSLTIVHTGGGSSGGGSAPRAAASSSGPATPVNRGPEAAQVSSTQQQVRDNDARAILQSELGRAQARLAELKAQFNGGQPTAAELEASQPEVYQARIDDLKAKIARQESDVQGIERELARLK